MSRTTVPLHRAEKIARQHGVTLLQAAMVHPPLKAELDRAEYPDSPVRLHALTTALGY